jgi:catechol 2,3-dioxygenase-like lactoylglutathione lyase family enzyme
MSSSLMTHVMLGTNDVARAKAFYDAVLGTLGFGPGHLSERHVYYMQSAGPALGIGLPYDGQAATHANGGTIGFAADDEATVRAFHAAGLLAGGSDEGQPGPRPFGSSTAYGAYLRDPDGNKICAYVT